jgi:hypothetical protein
VGRLKFDPQALLDALDAERQSRGLSWAELSRRLHVSTSTMRGMPDRRWGVELDGVLQMTWWLGRTVEDFSGGDGGRRPAPGDFASTGKLLRFDTRACYDALDAMRNRRGLSWEETARQVWPSGPWGEDQLKGMARGGRSEVNSALAIVEWLGAHIGDFTRWSLT